MKIKRIGIVANIEKEKIAGHVKSLKKRLEEKGVEVFLEMEISNKCGFREGLKWNDLARKSELIGCPSVFRELLHCVHFTPNNSGRVILYF
jgi:NAD+ kinase